MVLFTKGFEGTKDLAFPYVLLHFGSLFAPYLRYEKEFEGRGTIQGMSEYRIVTILPVNKNIEIRYIFGCALV